MLFLFSFYSEQMEERSEELEEEVENSQVVQPKKRKASKKTNKKDEPKTQPKPQRFRWTVEMQEKLLFCLGEVKIACEMKGIDFEADLIRLYGDVRTLMAQEYDENKEFGPVKVIDIPADVTPEEFKVLQAKKLTETKSIKQGYERIKQKTKDIRQDYRKAVNEGRRSGSGKIVCDNWDRLKSLWGGSPCTTALPNAVESYSYEEESFNLPGDLSDTEEKQSESESDDETEKTANSTDRSLDASSITSNNDSSTGKKNAPLNPTPQYVDNKRKFLEKKLSASQRDQVYINLAKDELKMKQDLANSLAEATRETNQAFTQISKSIEKVGESIGNGLALLAQAFAGNMPQPTPMPYYQQTNHPMSYQGHQPKRFPPQYNQSSPVPDSSRSSFLSQDNMNYEDL